MAAPLEGDTEKIQVWLRQSGAYRTMAQAMAECRAQGLRAVMVVDFGGIPAFCVSEGPRDFWADQIADVAKHMEGRPVTCLEVTLGG